MGNFNRDDIQGQKFGLDQLFYRNPSVLTLSGNLAIPANGPSVWILDPGGASRTLTMPAEANVEDKVFIFHNIADAVESLLIVDDAAAAIATVPQGGTVELACVKATWRILTPAGTAKALASGAGAGITNNTGGGSYSSEVARVGNIITTTIFIDIDGLDSSTTDLDVIGFDEATDQPAYLGRITTAQNGLIFEGAMACVETAAGGVTTVDLYASPEADNVFDALITDDTGEHALVTGSAAWTAGRVQQMTTLPLPNEYLYLTGGAAGTAAEYTAGQFIITLRGLAQ